MFRVMLNCRTGTKQLTCNTTGSYWEDCYHIVTMCETETYEEANILVESQKLNPVQVRSAWIEENFHDQKAFHCSC